MQSYDFEGICHFVPFLLVIVLSVLRFIHSDYPFGIFKLFLILLYNRVLCTKLDLSVLTFFSNHFGNCNGETSRNREREKSILYLLSTKIKCDINFLSHCFSNSTLRNQFISNHENKYEIKWIFNQNYSWIIFWKPFTVHGLLLVAEESGFKNVFKF